MRTFSAKAKNSLVTNLTDEVWYVLLVLQIGASYYYLCANSATNVVSNGITYQPYPFDVVLPTDSLDSIDTVQITIDNVDRLLVDALRAANEPLTFILRFVLASQPNQIELELTDLESDQISFDAHTISAVLNMTDTLNQQFPGRGAKYDPAQCPAMF